MNKNITTLILLVILIILVLGAGMFGKAIYDDIVGEDYNEVYKIENIATEEQEQSKTVNTEKNNTLQSLTSEEKNETKNEISAEAGNVINNFFYNQLAGNEKKIYDKLYQNKINLKKGNYKIEFGTEFNKILSEEDGGKRLGQDYQTAIEAFMHDNPDLFYINVNKMYLNVETTTRFLKTTHKVYISAAQDQTYFSDDFSSEEQVEETIGQIETVKNNILSTLKGNDYEKIMKIHDYLVDTIEYDSTYKAAGTYNINGALLEKQCVCEGYAKALKYLANEAEIMCEMMQGTATNSSGQTESHAWNCVKINGIWYEIDPTWDDPVFIGNGYKPNTYKYKYFLKGSNTFEKDHILSYQFSDNGKVFEYPLISTRDY